MYSQDPQDSGSDSDPSPDIQFFHTIDTQHTVDTEAFVNIDIVCPQKSGQHCLRLKVDTGASGNTLPLRILQNMYGGSWRSELSPTLTQLKAYNGTEIRCVGTIDLLCQYKGSKWANQTFYVVDVQGPAILGLPGCKAMVIVTINEVRSTIPPMRPIEGVDDLKRKYPTQFDTIGNFQGKATLHLKDDAKPTIDPPRKCSVHLRDKIKTELNDMEGNGIIRHVEHHTDWCSSMTTAVKKDGSLRLCLDPKRLNDALKRCPHKTPTLEEVNPTFAGARYFSKLDAKAG